KPSSLFLLPLLLLPLPPNPNPQPLRTRHSSHIIRRHAQHIQQIRRRRWPNRSHLHLLLLLLFGDHLDRCIRARRTKHHYPFFSFILFFCCCQDKTKLISKRRGHIRRVHNVFRHAPAGVREAGWEYIAVGSAYQEEEVWWLIGGRHG